MMKLFGILFCLGMTVTALTVDDLAHLDREPPPPPHRKCPLPYCDGCPTVEQLRAPGIGIALELGYGTAVVRHHDGTYEDIAQVEGDGAYLSVMERLATGPQQRIPDHFEDIKDNWERLRYIKQRSQRLLNKSLGLPASKDIGVLADMIKKLIALTQAAVDVEGIVLSSPDRIRLTYEELGDIFDYLRVEDRSKGDRRVFSVSAAYAGFGHGICPNYLSAYVCEREESELPHQKLLHIDFSDHGLSGGIRIIQKAFAWELTDRTFVQPSLGYQHSAYDDFWTVLESRIRLFAQSYPQTLTQLMFTGSRACEAKFASVVRDALGDIVAEGILDSLDTKCADFVYATARGAAELAKRRQEGPFGCQDTEECAKRRQSQRSSTHKMMVVQAVH